MHKLESVGGHTKIESENSVNLLRSRAVNQAIGNRTLTIAELHRRREELVKRTAELEAKLRAAGIYPDAAPKSPTVSRRSSELPKRPRSPEIHQEIMTNKFKKNQGIRNLVSGAIVGLIVTLGASGLGGFILKKNQKNHTAPSTAVETVIDVDAKDFNADLDSNPIVTEYTELAKTTPTGEKQDISLETPELTPEVSESISEAPEYVSEVQEVTPAAYEVASEEITRPVEVPTVESVTMSVTPEDVVEDATEDVTEESIEETDIIDEKTDETVSQAVEPVSASEPEVEVVTPQVEAELDITPETEVGRTYYEVKAEPVYEAEPASVLTEEAELTSETGPTVELEAEADPIPEVAPEPAPELVPEVAVVTDSVPDSVPATPSGPVLNSKNGRIQGPSGEETYYNLNMKRVVQNMHDMGFEGEYRVRDDGVKMFGNYVMVAADLNVHPRGSLVETSLGTGIVCDTGTFAETNPTQLDIATAW